MGTPTLPHSTRSDPYYLGLHSDLDDLVTELGQRLASETEVRCLLVAIQYLTDSKNQLSALLDEVHAKVHSLLKDKKSDLGDGIGVVEKVKDSTTKWDHDSIFDALLRESRAVDPGTGEVTIDGEEFAKKLRAAAAVSYWRKAALREQGLDPDEFSETSYGKPRVRFLSGGALRNPVSR